jgi:intein/homing endonuclease
MGVVGKYCCCENTRVSGKHGSIPIENLYGENLEVLSWNEKTDKLEVSVQSNFFDNGKKECIELELEDGRTITCTPDHKLITENGWIDADDIPVGGKIKVGPILPEVELDTNETIYARVLGYMITDGHISKNVSLAYFGNIMDAQLLAKDIETLSGVHPNIRKNGNCWEFCLPENIRTKILAENWIKGGNRTRSKELLPDVSKWSKSQIREFIAGMFGGDGWCPCYNKGDNKFTPIGFTQSRNNKDYIEEYMGQLSNMLKMFDIIPSIRISKRNNLFIGSLSLSMYDIEKFVTTIGYRYCYHKTIRASIVTFYYRIKNKAINSYRQFYNQVITSDMSIAGAYRKYVNNRSFPKAGQFLNRMNAMEFFGGDSFHSYSLGKNDDTLPTFELSLISKKSVGVQQVYDITVEDTHSFLANGIVAHNCV